MIATNPLTVRATGSFSRAANGRILVEARSRAFVARALHPMALVGRVPIVGLECADGVLKGLVLGTPQAGDELVIRYVPEPEIRTGLRFDLPPLNVA
jgi:hypothetical protein